MVLALGPTGTGRALAVGDANPDSYGGSAPLVLEDVNFSVAAPGVLSNDTREPGFGIDMCLVDAQTTSTEGGLVVWYHDGAFQYQSPQDFNGSDSFTYTMADFPVGDPCPAVYEDSALVTLTVTPVNDAPHIELAYVCLAGATQTAAEDSGPYSGSNDCVRMDSFGPSNESGQSLAEWVVTAANPALFAVQPYLEIRDATYGKLHFTPAQNATGSTTLTIRGRDSGGTANGGVSLSNPITVPVTITPVNDAPNAVADSFQYLWNQTLNISGPGLLANDSDIDGDPVTAIKTTDPAHGILTLAADGGFSYTPVGATCPGVPDSFSYRATDGQANSPARVVTLNPALIPCPTASPLATPTPSPTPSPEPTPTTEPTPTASPGATPTLDPFASPSASAPPEATATPAPTAEPVPVDDGKGLSLPVLVVIVLFGMLLAFGAAYYVPRWIQSQRTGRDIEDV